MRHNGRTKNFRLPESDVFPDPDSCELVVIRGNANVQDGLYIYIEPTWRYIKSEIGDQYDFPVTINKFFGRRSTNAVINSRDWSPLAIPVIDFKDSIYTHTAGASDVIVNKRSRFTVECEFSAQRSSGSNVSFGVRLMQRPSNGNACTLVQVWQPNAVYVEGNQVQFNGFLYEANWYTENQRPDQNSGEYQVWTNLGDCATGSANFQVIPGSYSYSICNVNGVPTAYVRSTAEITLHAGSAVRAEVATTSSGSVTLLSDTFRFRISEG